MVPINTSSLTATSVNSQPPLPPAAGTELSPSGSGAAPPSSRASTSKLQDGDSLVYNTDSIRSLENVELAVDETLLSSAAAKAASRPRRMSSNPRVSETENPFVEIAPRLASRRVRPLVIELIQALGHYIDAVWSVTHPDRRCPWVAEHERNEGSPLPHHASADEWDRWTSPMVTAVQEGKASGHVTAPPTHRDVAFWGEEVRFAMRDVDEVVGIYKGIFWAFSAAVKHGGYGEILPENVFGENSRGGNMARLLNDLEEAVWYVMHNSNLLTLQGKY